MEHINNNNRNCATCDYWLGQHSPHRLGFVEVTSKMAYGRCGAKGLNENRQYQAIYSCASYRKWRMLK